MRLIFEGDNNSNKQKQIFKKIVVQPKKNMPERLWYNDENINVLTWTMLIRIGAVPHKL